MTSPRPTLPSTGRARLAAVLLLAAVGQSAAVPHRAAAQIWGDVRKDGTIDDADAFSVIAHTIGRPLAADNYEVADVSGEGRITTLDALIILQYASGVDLPQFRVGTPAGDPAACTLPVPADASTFDGVDDVPYGPGPEQELDVLTPVAGGPRPLVVVIHGGGWRSGSKEDPDARDVARRLVRLGYTVGLLDYTLVTSDPATRFPAALNDVRRAVDFLHENAATYGIDPTVTFLMGPSAGGHLALLLAYEQPGAFRGVVSFFGPTDLRDLEAWRGFTGASSVQSFLGCRPETCPDRAAAASPIAAVSSSSTPTLLSHGLRDRTVPPAQSRRLRDALASAGVPVRLVELPGAEHGYRFFSEGAALKPAGCALLTFLEERTPR